MDVDLQKNQIFKTWVYKTWVSQTLSKNMPRFVQGHEQTHLDICATVDKRLSDGAPAAVGGKVGGNVGGNVAGMVGCGLLTTILQMLW